MQDGILSSDIIRETSEDEQSDDPVEGEEMQSLYEHQRAIVGFTVQYRVAYGKALYVTGSIPALGNWCTSKAMRL